jgi:hypothetical protein
LQMVAMPREIDRVFAVKESRGNDGKWKARKIPT